MLLQHTHAVISQLSTYMLHCQNLQCYCNTRTRTHTHTHTHIYIYIYIYIYIFLFVFMAPQPLVGLGLLTVEVSRSHSFRHFILGRTPLDEWSARHRNLYLTTNSTYKRQDMHAPGGIRTRNPSKRAATDPRLRALVQCLRTLSNENIFPQFLRLCRRTTDDSFR
jgi:hypothetical protein